MRDDEKATRTIHLLISFGINPSWGSDFAVVGAGSWRRHDDGESAMYDVDSRQLLAFYFSYT